MSLNVARTKLMTSIKELNMRWDKVREHWDDPVAKKFQETHIDPLDGMTRSAVSAIENISNIIHQAKRECE